jgi:FkbM family methyltransferase
MLTSSIDINGIDLKYGSLMEFDNRLNFFKAFSSESQDLAHYNEMKSFLKHIENKNTFFDVGSSYGIFSLIFSLKNKNAKTYSFDGATSVYLAINQTMMINNLENMKHFKTMIGDQDCYASVFQEKHQSLLANNTTGTLEIMLTLDTFSELYQVAPDCIKVDVEGAEYKVLQGASNVIDKHRPTLFLEVHPKFLKIFHNHSIYDVINFFEKYEYFAFDNFGNKIEDYKKYLEQETTDSNRTVWVPRETI